MVICKGYFGQVQMRQFVCVNPNGAAKWFASGKTVVDEPGEKPLGQGGLNQQQNQPTCGINAENQTRAHW